MPSAPGAAPVKAGGGVPPPPPPPKMPPPPSVGNAGPAAPKVPQPPPANSTAVLVSAPAAPAKKEEAKGGSGGGLGSVKLGPPPSAPPVAKTVPKPPPVPPKTYKKPPPAPVFNSKPVGYVTEEDVHGPKKVDPLDAMREKLLANPEFAKFPKMMKMKVPLLSILNQTRAAGKFSDDDICLFASKGEIEGLKKVGNYKGKLFL